MPVTIEKIRKFSHIFTERSNIALGTELKKLYKKTNKKPPEEVIRKYRYGEEDL